ncbi:MAG: hypothetical protein ACQESR_01165 [Planctomycetota bacterium]
MIFLRLITVVSVLLVGPGGLLRAASNPSADARITKVRVGVSGAYKLGHWIPVWLTIRGGEDGFSGAVELSTVDSDNVNARFMASSDPPLEVKPGEQWSGWRYLKAGRLAGPIRVQLRGEAGSIVASRMVENVSPHPSTWQWVITTGADVGVDDAKAFLARMTDQPVVATLLTDPGGFPDDWIGYEGVNVIVVPTGTESVLEALEARQFAALMRWLRLGGRLVMSGGRRAETLFAPNHRFHAIRPGRIVELDPYWKASGLENFAQAAEPIRLSEESRLAVFSDLRGRALCFEGAGGPHDRPMIVQYPIGFGTVTYVAVDLELPPIRDWPARPRLLARLLRGGGEDEDSGGGDDGGGQVTHLGFEDLTGQLRAAMDQFPGVTLVQFSWIAAIIAVYIVLAGPIDFFGLRRLGRPLWTWITFPLVVLLFCGLAIWLSHSWKGSRAQLNQVDIVDIDLDDQLVRGTTWTNLYSPRSTKLDIAVKPVVSWPRPESPADMEREPRVLLSWQGLPGRGLGGMNASATVGMPRDEYVVRYPLFSARAGKGGGIEGLGIYPASTKGLLARWASAADIDSNTRLTTDQFDLLEGVVTNPLDVELTRCSVYYQNWAYPLPGPLAPGETVRIRNAQPLDLRWKLTGRSVEGMGEKRSPWRGDNLSEVDRLLSLLMFHGAAGGRVYTGLTHRYQSFVDLSRHLRNGRAILVGRGKQPASRLTANRSGRDEPTSVMDRDARRHWTYYRIMIPVHSAAAPADRVTASSNPARFTGRGK